MKRVRNILCALPICALMMVAACGGQQLPDDGNLPDVPTIVSDNNNQDPGNLQVPDTASKPGSKPLILDPIPDPATLPNDPKPIALFAGDYEFAVSVHETSFKYGGSAESYSVRWHPYEGEMWWSNPVMSGSKPPVPLIEVEVVAHEAEGIRMAFMELQYDAENMQVEYIAPPEEFGEQRLGYITGDHVGTRSDLIPYCSMMLRPQDKPGLSGEEVVLARFYFNGNTSLFTISERPLSAPVQPDCMASLSFDSEAGNVSWLHSLVGDFDQNGVVDIFDWSEIAYFFGDSAADRDSLAGWVANPSSNTVFIDSITRTMSHSQTALDGYNVYVGSMADYPAAGSLLGSVAIGDAVGEANVDRLLYSFEPETAPVAGDVFWVRPYLGEEEGIESAALEIQAAE